MSRVLFRAGRTRAAESDLFIISGRMNFVLADLPEDEEISVRLVRYEDSQILFEQDLSSSYDPSKYSLFYHRDLTADNGELSMFTFNFRNGSFTAYATGQDCSGWKAPMFFEVQVGDEVNSFYVTDEAGEEDFEYTGADSEYVLSSRSAMPIQFLVGQEDYVSVLKNTVKTNSVTSKTAGLITGKITTTVGSSEVTEAVISWDGFSETISLTKNAKLNLYTYRGVGVAGSSIFTANFNLDACTFTIVVKGTDLGSAENFDVYLQ